MATPYQIMTAETGTANSLPFRINLGTKLAREWDLPYIGLYGTIGTALVKLQWRAADGIYYNTDDTFSRLGLFKLPSSSEIILRLSVTAGGGSSISAEVINGIAV